MFKPTNQTMATEKTYIGNGRQKEGSAYLVLSLSVSNLEEMLAEHRAKGGGSYVKAIVAKRINKGKFGETHSVYLPVEKDDADVRYNALADQQELESLLS